MQHTLTPCPLHNLHEEALVTCIMVMMRLCHITIVLSPVNMVISLECVEHVIQMIRVMKYLGQLNQVCWTTARRHLPALFMGVYLRLFFMFLEKNRSSSTCLCKGSVNNFYLSVGSKSEMEKQLF